MDSLIQDIRFGCRMLYKNLRFSLVIIFCLALGIGPNTTLFSVLNIVLLQPLDLHEQDRLVWVNSLDKDRPDANPSNISYPDYEAISRDVESASHTAAFSFGEAVVRLPQGAEQAFVMSVSANFFDMAGREPLLGDTFHRQENAFPGSMPVVVLGYDFWMDRLGGDEAIVGAQFIVNGFPFEILGVMPKSFTGVTIGMQPSFWAPLLMMDQIRPSNPGMLEESGHRWLMAVARLEDGASMGHLNKELAAVAADLALSRPNTNQMRLFEARPFDQLMGAPRRAVSGIIALVMGLVGIVLLVACASVAALLLARSTERRQEISVRMAMGAGRRRLIRQLLTESTLLALIAGVVALIMTLWSMDLVLDTLSAADLPLHVEAGLDLPVLIYTLLISVVAGLLFGLAPALQTTRTDLNSALKDQPAGDGAEYRISRWRNAFIVAQFAMSVLLLVVAGLFVRSLIHGQKVNPGFDSNNLLTVSLQPGQYGYVGEALERFTHEARTKLEAIPGVSSVALARLGPLPGHRTGTITTPLVGDYESGKSLRLLYNFIGPGYFETMKIPLLEGEGFQTRGQEGVVVINETFAKQAWPGEPALGKYISPPQGREFLRVIGVAADVHYYRPGEEQQPYLYLPLGDVFNHELSLIMACNNEPASLTGNVAAVLKGMNPDLVTTEIATVGDAVDRALLPARIAAMLFGILGFLALLLAVIGVYGVMGYSVNQRQREIGIRMALGGEVNSMILLLMRRGLILVSVGAVLGLAGAFALSGVFAGLLGSINPKDPITFICVPLLLGVVAFISLYLPARRITRMNPMAALRYE